MLTNELILNHLHLAEKIAKSQYRKTPPQVQYDELQSAAYMGLVDAANRYDGKRDFGKYASFRIIGEIKDYLRSLKWDRNTNQLCSIPENFDIAGETESENFDDILDGFAEKRISLLGKRILRMYYGERLSISVIAEKLNLSDARISQLVKQNIETIRLAI